MRPVDYVWLEGHLEVAVCQKLLGLAGLDGSETIYNVAGGSARFWELLAKRNRSAQAGLLVVALGDLEQHPCPVTLIRRYLPKGPAPGFCLRLAVRMTESWLLADAEAMGKFLHVPLSKLPKAPDQIAHPKRLIVELAQRYAPKALASDLVPPAGMTGLVGPAYRVRMDAFVRQFWHPREARRRSPSLDRAIRALSGFARP